MSESNPKECAEHPPLNLLGSSRCSLNPFEVALLDLPRLKPVDVDPGASTAIVNGVRVEAHGGIPEGPIEARVKLSRFTQRMRARETRLRKPRKKYTRKRKVGRPKLKRDAKAARERAYNRGYERRMRKDLLLDPYALWVFNYARHGIKVRVTREEWDATVGDLVNAVARFSVRRTDSSLREVTRMDQVTVWEVRRPNRRKAKLKRYLLWEASDPTLPS